MADIQKFESLVQRLEAAVKILEKGGAATPSGGSGDQADDVTSPALLDYVQWINDKVAPFLALSEKIGKCFNKKFKQLSRAKNKTLKSSKIFVLKYKLNKNINK